MSLSFDVFNDHRSDDTIFVLSHAHTDHYRSIKKTFPFIVHCSTLTKKIISIRENGRYDKILVDDLIVGEVYKDSFFVFKTSHTLDSIGVYDLQENTLYLGDGQVDDDLLHQFTHASITGKCITTIVEDAFNEFPVVDCEWPTTQKCVDRIHDRLVTYSRIGMIINTDVVCHLLTLLQRTIDFYYTFGPDVDDHIKFLCDQTLTNNKDHQYEIVILKYNKKRVLPLDLYIVKPSMLYFLYFAHCKSEEFKDGIEHIYFPSHANPSQKIRLNKHFETICQQKK